MNQRPIPPMQPAGVSRRFTGRAPLVHLTLMWVRESLRWPATVFWLYGFPILLTLVLGAAFQNSLGRRAAVDVQQGPGAEAVVESLGSFPEFQVETHPAADCRRRLRTGKSDLVVARGDASDHYDYYYVPLRPESERARDAVNNRLQQACGRRDVLATTSCELNESGSRYIDFLVPGMLGMTVMQSGLWGVGYLTVNARIRKLLKRFLATPMRKSDFLAALVLSRLWFIVSAAALLAVVTRLAFGVANYGRWLDVGLLLVLGTLAFACLGLLLVSRVQTLETAAGLLQLVMFPMWIFSGVFFSPDRFPAVLQPLAHALPLTSLVAALRGVMLEGLPLGGLLDQVGLLAVWAAVSFLLALRWFRWT